MRRALFSIVLVVLSGCGGDSTTGDSSARFPAVAGAYQVNGALNSPPGAGAFSGSLVLSQASRELSALTGTANVSVTVAGRTERFTAVSYAELGDYGAIQLYLDSPTSSSRVHLMGQVNGRVFSGSTDVTVSNAVYFGTFTAKR